MFEDSDIMSEWRPVADLHDSVGMLPRLLSTKTAVRAFFSYASAVRASRGRSGQGWHRRDSPQTSVFRSANNRSGRFSRWDGEPRGQPDFSSEDRTHARAGARGGYRASRYDVV